MLLEAFPVPLEDAEIVLLRSWGSTLLFNQ